MANPFVVVFDLILDAFDLPLFGDIPTACAATNLRLPQDCTHAHFSRHCLKTRNIIDARSKVITWTIRIEIVQQIAER